MTRQVLDTFADTDGMNRQSEFRRDSNQDAAARRLTEQQIAVVERRIA